MSIGERISQMRKEKGISQGQLAKAMGVSRQAVSKWENGQNSPETVKLIQLADILETDVEYLASGKEIPSPSPTASQPEEVPEKLPEKIEEKPAELPKPEPIIIQAEPVIERVVQVVSHERVVEKPVIRKRIQVKYVRNPLEYAAVALGFFVLGLLIGLIF